MPIFSGYVKFAIKLDIGSIHVQKGQNFRLSRSIWIIKHLPHFRFGGKMFDTKVTTSTPFFFLLRLLLHSIISRTLVRRAEIARGALRYNQEKVAQGKGEVLDHSFLNTSEKGIMKEVAMVRVQRPDLKKCFYHTSINFPKEENVSNDLMIKIGREYLKANGFNQHQYIMFRHKDAGHPHFHILVNRIGYDGSVVSDSDDFARSEKVLRDLERKYNLTQVVGSREAKERALSNNEIAMNLLFHQPSLKFVLSKGHLDPKTEFPPSTIDFLVS